MEVWLVPEKLRVGENDGATALSEGWPSPTGTNDGESAHRDVLESDLRGLGLM